MRWLAGLWMRLTVILGSPISWAEKKIDLLSAFPNRKWGRLKKAYVFTYWSYSRRKSLFGINRIHPMVSCIFFPNEFEKAPRVFYGHYALVYPHNWLLNIVSISSKCYIEKFLQDAFIKHHPGGILQWYLSIA